MLSNLCRRFASAVSVRAATVPRSLRGSVGTDAVASGGCARTLSVLSSVSSPCALSAAGPAKHQSDAAVKGSLSLSARARADANAGASASLSTMPKRDSSVEYIQPLKLNMLRNNPGARKQKKRVGRGVGSGRGKTSGRGHKGKKARSGGSIKLGFEGGQTKFYKLLPKRGFNNKRHAMPMVPVNVGTIQDFIDMGRFPHVTADTPADEMPVLTMKDFVDAGITNRTSIKHGMKLLSHGKDRLRTPFRLDISRASKEAIRALEEVGGQVTCVHYNRLALRVLLHPHKFGANPPKRARPPPRLQAYYTNWDVNRGYLSVQAQMRDLLAARPELAEAFEKAIAATENDEASTDGKNNRNSEDS